jgi:hypothetical protein
MCAIYLPDPLQKSSSNTCVDIRMKFYNAALKFVFLCSSLRNVGGSTQVPARAWNNARIGTRGLPQPVKLERRRMTYTVSVWRQTQ